MDVELFCLNCNKKLVGNQTKYCCKDCSNKALDNYDREKAQIAQNKKRLQRKLFLLEKHNFMCSKCGYNKNLSALEFHHIDPETKSFTIDGRNLTSRSIESIFLEAEKCIVLCANCHRELHNSDHNLEKLDFSTEEYSRSFIKYNKRDPNFCQKCGKELSHSASKLCEKCSRINSRKVERPSKEGLLELIKTKSFTEIGKMFNVTDSAIRKWCISYELPSTKKELKALGLLNN